MRRVPARLGDRLTHQRHGPDRHVDPGGIDHVDDRGHAAPLGAHHLRQRVVEFQLARRVGPVAELVLESHEPQPVALPIGQHTRHQEAREPLGRLGQHQEGIAHRGGGEPLVALQQVGALQTGGGRADWLGDGGVGPHIRAALPLGHAHADEATRLARRLYQAGVVIARHQARPPGLGQLRLVIERPERRRGHRGRAAVAYLDLTHQVHQCVARDRTAIARPGLIAHAVNAR